MQAESAPVYLSKLRVRTRILQARYPMVVADSEWTTVLRSTLMKPEHEAFIPELHRRVERFASLAANLDDSGA